MFKSQWVQQGSNNFSVRAENRNIMYHFFLLCRAKVNFYEHIFQQFLVCAQKRIRGYFLLIGIVNIFC